MGGDIGSGITFKIHFQRPSRVTKSRLRPGLIKGSERQEAEISRPPRSWKRLQEETELTRTPGSWKSDNHPLDTGCPSVSVGVRQLLGYVGS